MTMSAVNAKPIEETVIYSFEGIEFEGYLAYDSDHRGSRPGVIIFHQWMGLTDYEKRRARELADLGYIAFAADLYGKGMRPSNMQEASQLSGTFYGNREMFRNRTVQALEKIRSFKNVDVDKIAAIGYCFGGTSALELVRGGAEVSGIVSFHGGLSNPNPEDAGNIKCPVLVLHGADDPYVPQDQVNSFKAEMGSADVDYIFVSFANTVHAFTQPLAGDDNSKGAAYNLNADKRSWEYMKDFLDEIF